MRVGIKGVAPPPACLFPSPAAALRGGEWRPFLLPAWPRLGPSSRVCAPACLLSPHFSRSALRRCRLRSLWVLIASSPVVSLGSLSSAPRPGRLLGALGARGAPIPRVPPKHLFSVFRFLPVAPLTFPRALYPAVSAMSAHLQWMVVRNCSSFLIKRNKQTYSTVSGALTPRSEGGACTIVVLPSSSRPRCVPVPRSRIT